MIAGENRPCQTPRDNRHYRSGVGIPAENLTRIFQHGCTTRKTGPGFALHSGALTAHSNGPGHGATFTLELPCQPEPPQP